MTAHLASSYIAEVKRAVEEAAESDYLMPIWLPFLPAISTASGFLLIVSTLLFGRVLLFLASLLLLITLTL